MRRVPAENREKADDLARENDAQHRKNGQNYGHVPKYSLSEPPRIRPRSVPEIPGKQWNERRAERAFRRHPPYQGGYAKREDERIGGRRRAQ
jgi:hypothetical protein